MLPVYPGSDLDRARNMLATLGSFWYRTFTGSDQLRSYAIATGESVAQSHRNVLELAQSLSRYTIPVFHTENWLPITLRKSQKNSRATTSFKFDRTAETFNTNKTTFNTTIRTDTFAYSVDKDLASVHKVFNQLIFPKVTLSKNADFILDRENSAIVFTSDPFENPNFLRRGVYDKGRLADEEIVLWGFKAQLDYEYVFNQFAYALGIYLRSSENAKTFMNSLFSGLVDGGASIVTFNSALSALCDVAVTETDGEVVDVISLDAHGLFIATNKKAYRFAASAIPVVSAGQSLLAGDPLVNAFEVIEFNTGNVPESLSALALDQGFVDVCFYGDLVFENKEVPLEVDTNHPSGYTFVKFQVGGFPVDTELFFDELHRRGVEAADFVQDPCDRRNLKLGTLAHLLDRRAQPEGEPKISDLPKKINPLQFIAQNIFRNNVFVALLRVPALGQNRLGLYNIRHLRQILPPHTAAFFVYELGALKDKKNGDDILESLSRFTGMAPQYNVVPEVYVKDRGVMVSTISGTCQ